MATTRSRLVALTALAAGALLPLAIAAAAQPDPLVPAIKAMDMKAFLAEVNQLASDDFEGRSPGTTGEDRTVAYLAAEFKRLGLKPGNPDGSYLQSVPMTAFQGKPAAHFSVGARHIELKFPEDFVAFTPEREKHVSVKDSDLVFVGYGIQAPEYKWDDYKGVDVRGKTIVMLINDPPIADPADPTKLDAKMFGGTAMTYYGRWTYKFEIAHKLGARAAIIVHETGPAAYPYSVVISSWKGENFVLHDGKPVVEYPSIASWIHLDRAHELFRAAGQDFDALKKSALSRDFHPVPLKARVSFEIDNSFRDVGSRNVVGLLPGSDPKLKDEYVVYSAHWDHFGWDPKLPGTKHEQVFHGAHDNASGTAGLIELARAFKALPVAPKRSILFVATTAEERGLLGARYYAQHPLYPLAKTVANINLDGVNTIGVTRDIQLTSSGKSTMDDVVRAHAKQMGIEVQDDAHPERGSFFRADQLEFARVGVPVAYLGAGQKVIGKPEGYGDKLTVDYIAHDYHQVTDLVTPEWDTRGTAQHLELLLRTGYDIAQGSAWPQWYPTAEFKAARDATLAAPAAKH
jgi:Zn-dependent M28 family amino/carboxypeptidase